MQIVLPFCTTNPSESLELQRLMVRLVLKFESLLHRHIRNDKTPENVKVFRGFVFSGGRKRPVWERPWKYSLLGCPRPNPR